MEGTLSNYKRKGDITMKKNDTFTTDLVLVERSFDFVTDNLELELIRNCDDDLERSTRIDTAIKHRKKREGDTLNHLKESHDLGYNKGYDRGFWHGWACGVIGGLIGIGISNYLEYRKNK